MSNTSIWPIDRTLSGYSTPGQSGPGSNRNEGVTHIPQSSITGALPSDCWTLASGWVFALSRNAVGVFYSSNQLGHYDSELDVAEPV